MSARAYNDGWVTDDAVNSSETTYNIGKIYWFASGDSFYDAFMTYSFTTLPPTAVLVSAKLDVCLREVIGNPWGNLGSLYVGRVEPYSSINTSLYYATSFDTKVFWPSRPASSCGAVDVTDMVRNAVNTRSFAYLRLFFTRAPRGGTQEYIKVDSSRGSLYPLLILTYTY